MKTQFQCSIKANGEWTVVRKNIFAPKFNSKPKKQTQYQPFFNLLQDKLKLRLLQSFKQIKSYNNWNLAESGMTTISIRNFSAVGASAYSTQPCSPKNTKITYSSLFQDKQTIKIVDLNKQKVQHQSTKILIFLLNKLLIKCLEKPFQEIFHYQKSSSKILIANNQIMKLQIKILTTTLNKLIKKSKRQQSQYLLNQIYKIIDEQKTMENTIENKQNEMQEVAKVNKNKYLKSLSHLRFLRQTEYITLKQEKEIYNQVFQILLHYSAMKKLSSKPLQLNLYQTPVQSEEKKQETLILIKEESIIIKKVESEGEQEQKKLSQEKKVRIKQMLLSKMKESAVLQNPLENTLEIQEPKKEQKFLEKIIENIPQSLNEYQPNHYSSQFSKRVNVHSANMQRQKNSGEEIIIQRIFNLSYSPIKKQIDEDQKEKEDKKKILMKDSKWKLCQKLSQSFAIMNVNTGKKWEPQISSIFDDKFKNVKKNYQFPGALSRAKSMPIITPKKGDRMMKISWNAYKLKKEQRLKKESVEEQLNQQEQEQEEQRRNRRNDMVWLILGYMSSSFGILGYYLID